MILYSLVKEQIEERQRKREAIGEARGKELGIEFADGEWEEWEARREAAKAAGEDFTEPNPAEKRNDAPDDK